MTSEAAKMCGCTQEETESCACGGFCPCHEADPRERHQCCGRVVRPWPHDRCMCVQPAKHIRCEGCGIPIPEPGENPDPAALLCDACYETNDPWEWVEVENNA